MFRMAPRAEDERVAGRRAAARDPKYTAERPVVAPGARRGARRRSSPRHRARRRWAVDVRRARRVPGVAAVVSPRRHAARRRAPCPRRTPPRRGSGRRRRRRRGDGRRDVARAQGGTARRAPASRGRAARGSTPTSDSSSSRAPSPSRATSRKLRDALHGGEQEPRAAVKAAEDASGAAPNFFGTDSKISNVSAGSSAAPSATRVAVGVLRGGVEGDAGIRHAAGARAGGLEVDASGGRGHRQNALVHRRRRRTRRVARPPPYVPFVYGVKFAAYVPEDVAFAAFAEILNGRVAAAVVLPSAFGTPPPRRRPRSRTPPRWRRRARSRAARTPRRRPRRFPKWSRASTTKATGARRRGRRRRRRSPRPRPTARTGVAAWNASAGDARRSRLGVSRSSVPPSVASRVKFPLLVASNTSSYDPSRASSREASNATASTAVPRAPTSRARTPPVRTRRRPRVVALAVDAAHAERGAHARATTRSVAVTSDEPAPHAIGALDVLEKASPGSASIAVADAARAATRFRRNHLDTNRAPSAGGGSPAPRCA